MDFSLTLEKDYKKYYYYLKIMIMIFVLFKSRIIVGPMIMEKRTNIINQITVKTDTELFLYNQSIRLYSEP